MFCRLYWICVWESVTNWISYVQGNARQTNQRHRISDMALSSQQNLYRPIGESSVCARLYVLNENPMGNDRSRASNCKPHNSISKYFNSKLQIRFRISCNLKRLIKLPWTFALVCVCVCVENQLCGNLFTKYGRKPSLNAVWRYRKHYVPIDFLLHFSLPSVYRSYSINLWLSGSMHTLNANHYKCIKNHNLFRVRSSFFFPSSFIPMNIVSI